MSSVEMHMNIV